MLRDQVREFHSAFGVDVELHMLKEKLSAAIAERPYDPWLDDIADALADLDYVVEGTRLELGINGDPIAAEVHRANMAKVGGTVRADGKILKPAGWVPPGWVPPGWVPPDIDGELRKQGWEG